MMEDMIELVDTMIADHRHGWSIGVFGAVGEFTYDDGEDAVIRNRGSAREVITARGGIRIDVRIAARIVAYDTLSSDGDTWGQAIAFCFPSPNDMEHGRVRALGADYGALRPADRTSTLFDLGVGRGHVHFCVRTADPALDAALRAIEGRSLLEDAGRDAMAEMLRAQPHRVLLSPLARVEVFSAIPATGGDSPEGPHTHLLPKMLGAGRTHAANAPIPDGYQPVLMLHPGSPWRDALGRRMPFDSGLDEMFAALLDRFGSREDRDVMNAISAALNEGLAPETFAWPQTRRGRAKARITLRRIAQRTPGSAVEAWRRTYDRLPAGDAVEVAADV